MSTLRIMYRYHIPTQVEATDENYVVRKPLPDRFSAAVDQAAMKNDLAATDAYLAGWRWSQPQLYLDNVEQAVQAVVDQIIQQYEEKPIPSDVVNIQP